MFYRLLHQMGIFGDQAPARLREFRTPGQLSPEELIDRYALQCRPVRDLLVDYLRERQAALDYSSLKNLSHFLGRCFWQDLERHHPGIASLHLPAEVAAAWKQRLRTRPQTVTASTGEKTVTYVPRVNYRQCLTPVRAFYLDLAQWAVEDPARWAPWAVPCPVGGEEISQRKFQRHRKARMDARTRERLPVLPVLVRTTAERRKAAEALLAAARQARPGRDLHRRRADPDPVHPHQDRTGEDLGRRPGHRQATQPRPGRRPRVLGLGRCRSPAPDRLPRRGTARDHPPQPGAIPAAHHR